MFEMGESLNIITQCITKLNSSELKLNSLLFTTSKSVVSKNNNTVNNKLNNYVYMEDLIEHFLR
jgi:NADH:ubiquinone oxidoreductase subunit D